MKFFYKKIILSSFVFFLIFSIQNIKIIAQGVLPLSSSETISISVSPEIPRIGAQVKINVESSSIDLSTKKIVWYINDKVQKEGIGEKELIIQNQSDTPTKIRVSVTKSDGSKIESSTEISSSEIDLIIEPLSYAPPFYKGKPYYVEQGTFYATVVPNIKINGKKIDSENIFYKWTRNRIVLGKSSGVGKDSIKITGSVPIEDISLEVEAYDKTSQKLLAVDSKTIAALNPEVLFYEKNPLYGILYNKAISNSYYIGERDELNILAEPFSFDFLKNTTDNAEYSWKINDKMATSSENKNELLVVQQADKLKGIANISVNILNLKRDFQEKSDSFNLEFGK